MCAPGVEFRDGKFYLYIQQNWHKPDIHILWGESENGTNFICKGIALESVAGSQEGGIYDAAVRVLNGQPYLLYSGFPFPYITGEGEKISGIHGDIYLASSQDEKMGGGWAREGKILGHHEVPFQNQHSHPKYEWGLEGGDLAELIDGSILMAATSFVQDETPGCRQRVFLAWAEKPQGPYQTLGILTNPCNWSSRENGHPTIVRHDGQIYVFFQTYTTKWRLALASLPESSLPIPVFELSKSADVD